MEILTEEELRDRMTECYDEMCLYSEKGDYKKAFEMLYEMWELLSGNKIDHEESFSVVAGIIENAIDCGDKEVMRQWIGKMDYIAEKRERETGDKGEKEYYRGKVEYELGNYEEARKNLHSAVKNGWRLTEYDKKYADFLADKKNRGKSDRNVGLNVNDSNAVGKGNEELDEKTYKKITSLSNRADKCAEKGELDKAKQLFLEALAYVPLPKYNWEASTWLYTALGDVSYLDGKYDSAIEYLNEALKCPDGIGNPFILLRLGESFYESHNMEKARKYLIQAYMCEGAEIFEGEDKKYRKLIDDFI